MTITYLDGYVADLVQGTMEATLRALADESRRTMLEALADGPATAGELAALLPIARPGVSRHLRVLREAGLVDVRHVAQRRIYSLRPQPLAEVNDWLSRYLMLWNSGWMPCTPRRRPRQRHADRWLRRQASGLGRASRCRLH